MTYNTKKNFSNVLEPLNWLYTMVSNGLPIAITVTKYECIISRRLQNFTTVTPIAQLWHLGILLMIWQTGVYNRWYSCGYDPTMNMVNTLNGGWKRVRQINWVFRNLMKTTGQDDVTTCAFWGRHPNRSATHNDTGIRRRLRSIPRV